jgi:stress response protein YsnF
MLQNQSLYVDLREEKVEFSKEIVQVETKNFQKKFHEWR